jgi:NADH dehydrogenase FAD-containing subunit
VQCVSPRNHMVFTPLLASTAVGTLEFRSVALPVRDIQPALTWPQNSYLAAEAKSIHPDKREVECESADGAKFWLSYDLLVIATGAAGSTFGIPGVMENAHFLRDVAHASKIRSKIIENLHLASTPGCSLTASIPRACFLVMGHLVKVTHVMGTQFSNSALSQVFRGVKASFPEAAVLSGWPGYFTGVHDMLAARLNEGRMSEMHGTCSLFGNVVCAYHAHSRGQMFTHPAGRSLDDRSKLLHIIIVGGGPTGVEVTGELIDLVGTDIKRLYPDLARDIRVTLVEARDILGNFDVRLREYAARHLTRQGVKLVKVGKAGHSIGASCSCVIF